ncbi:excalibur calcium-binding domain-containing protein [Streptodolium elevatio]|uniref:Excalibur calcium-binding domain-containing protein n=1 Tax=Streptodolium elevatio TaxID=3157996 RepID=A0ABV3D963_9ACTN
MTYPSQQPWGAPPPPPPMRQPWHTKTGWIVVLLIVFAPVGIFLLYRAGIWRGTARHVVAAVAGIWFLIIAIGSAAGDPKDKEADKPTEPAAVISTTPAAPGSSAPPSTEAAPVPATTAPEPTTAAPEPPPTSAQPVTVAPPAPVETKPAPPPATKPAPAPTTREPTPEPEPTPEEESVYYKNCKAAKDAGAAPVRIGQPGYGRHLDSDGDGVGCES